MASKKSNEPGLPVKIYLILYNALNYFGWAYVLFLTVKSLVNTGDYTKTYDAIGKPLLVVQSVMALEIFHSLFGLVRSPVMTTIIQVFSRLFLVWAVVDQFPFPEIREHWAYSTMAIAWAITEVVRYAYYALGLIGSQPGFLVWCRYTFFYILYPLGAGSEAALIKFSLPFAKSISPLLYYGYILILFTYIPGFYTMYSHMIRQRRKYVKGGSKGATEASRKARKID
ncbi:uncharacterized protein VTP21DRAFT_4950 [Calcarisporiella thermophila]|uniref:uncharacterized protein n=1 Tax=Calcarisporiella thermophila TaxID=911321 RepID=UPI00374470DB